MVFVILILWFLGAVNFMVLYKISQTKNKTFWGMYLLSLVWPLIALCFIYQFMRDEVTANANR